MGLNLTGQLISNTYEDLVQISGSILTDGLGNNINSLTITASHATVSDATNEANLVNVIETTTNQNFPVTFVSADANQQVRIDANAGDFFYNPSTNRLSLSNLTVSNPILGNVDGNLNGTASFADNTISASHAVNSDFAITASFAQNVIPIDTGSFYLSSSVIDATITFNQGDGTTEAVTVNNVSNAFTASIATSASFATTAISASHALNADNAISASFATTASFALNAVSGLISGTGVGSLISANFQPTASVANGINSIAIGNNTAANSNRQVVLGNNIISTGDGSVTIGNNMAFSLSSSNNVVIGSSNTNQLIGSNGATNTVLIGGRDVGTFINPESVSVGFNSTQALGSTNIGFNTNSNNFAVAVGRSATAGGVNAVAVGANTSAVGQNSIAIGEGQQTSQQNEININSKFRFNSGSNGIIELKDDTSISGSLTALLSSAVENNIVFYNTSSGLFTFGIGGDIINTGSFMITGSIATNVLTFTKADGSTFDLTVDTSAVVTSSLLITASISDATTTFTKGDGSTFALTTNNVQNAVTATTATEAIVVDVLSTATNTNFPVTFVSSDGFEQIRIDSDVNDFVYNPSTNRLSLSNLTVTNPIIGTVTGGTLVDVLSTATNTDFPITFVSSSGTQQVRIDTSANDFVYNPGLNRLSVSNLTVINPILGNVDGNLTGTASFADNVTSASHAINADTASFASFATSASFAQTASFALNAASAPAGLISGSGIGSLISANYQPTASIALGDNSIAIGNGSIADGTNQVVLGSNISSSAPGNTDTVVIGANNLIQGDIQDSIIIGNNFNAQNFNTKMVVIGANPSTKFINEEGVAIGFDASCGLATVSIGRAANGNNLAVALGRFASATGDSSIGLGSNTVSAGVNSIAIGLNQTTDDTDEINIGGKFRFNSGSNGIINLEADTLVLGSLTATSFTGSLEGTASFVTSASFATTAISASHALNADNVVSASFATTASFALNAASTPAGLISGSGTDSLISANYQSTASVASGINSTAIGNNTSADSDNQISIGTNISSSGGGNDRSIAIGTTLRFQGTDNDNIIIGNNVNCQGGKNKSIMIGARDFGTFTNPESVSVGFNSTQALGTTAIGFGTGGSNFAVAVGRSAGAGGDSAIAIGTDTAASGQNSIVIGVNQTSSIIDEINIGGRFRFNNDSSGSIELTHKTLISGSLRGNVSALGLSSNTASLDLATSNFFTLLLDSGSDSFIDPSNILPGQIINLRLIQPDLGFGTVSFPASVKQVSGSTYVPTPEAFAQDIVTFTSFDSINLYLTEVKNFV